MNFRKLVAIGLISPGFAVADKNGLHQLKLSTAESHLADRCFAQAKDFHSSLQKAEQESHRKTLQFGLTEFKTRLVSAEQTGPLSADRTIRHGETLDLEIVFQSRPVETIVLILNGADERRFATSFSFAPEKTPIAGFVKHIPVTSENFPTDNRARRAEYRILICQQNEDSVSGRIETFYVSPAREEDLVRVTPRDEESVLFKKSSVEAQTPPSQTPAETSPGQPDAVPHPPAPQPETPPEPPAAEPDTQQQPPPPAMTHDDLLNPLPEQKTPPPPSPGVDQVQPPTEPAPVVDQPPAEIKPAESKPEEKKRNENPPEVTTGKSEIENFIVVMPFPKQNQPRQISQLPFPIRFYDTSEFIHPFAANATDHVIESCEPCLAEPFYPSPEIRVFYFP